MATYYIYSGATGSANGSSWANAFTQLAAAHNATAAGDTLFIAHDHLEVSGGSNINIISKGTEKQITKVICVNRLGTVPPTSADRRATAQVTTTGDANLTVYGHTHYDGVIFLSGNGTGAPRLALLSGGYGEWMRLDNCSLRLGSTGAGWIDIGTGTGCQLEMNNTTLSFSSTGQMVLVNSVLKWRDTPNAILGTIPNTVLVSAAGYFGDIEIIGVDLSAVTGTKVVFGAGGSQSVIKASVVDCKVASVNNLSSQPPNPAFEISCIRTGATAANYTLHHRRVGGLVFQNTAVVRSGGATDGTTPISWEISTLNCITTHPLELPPIAVWNDNVNVVVTATVEGLVDGGELPTNQQIWVEVEYTEDASSAKTIIDNDGASSILTGAQSTQSPGTGVWSGGGTRTKFKLDTLFVPRIKGFITARVKVGKSNSTYYIDPKVRLS